MHPSVLPSPTPRALVGNLLLWTILCCLPLAKAQAQIFEFTNDQLGEPSFVADNVVATDVTLGTGILPVVAATPPCGANEGFGAQGWPTTNTFDVTNFNTQGWYVGFSIDPDPGYGLKITGFSTRSRRQNLTGVASDGPIAMRYAYSVDNGMSWVWVNPGNPQANNLCAGAGVVRIWPAWTTVNTSNTVMFRVYGLSSGSDLTGDLFLRNIIVSGEVCADEPDIVLGTFPEACFSSTATTVALPYSSSTGTEYIVDYDAAANMVGFVDNLVYAPLSTMPQEISLTIPANATAGTYNGTITVRNGCGFVDPTPVPFTVTVHPTPPASITGVENSGGTSNDGTICAGDDITLTATGGESYNWSNGEEDTDNIVVNPTSTSTYTVTVTSEEGCTNTSSFMVTTIAVTATADAGEDKNTCEGGIVFLSGTIGGTATTSTWSDNGAGGSFDDASDLTTFYTPPSMGAPANITITLTTDGSCPASDEVVISYGDIPALELVVSGPTSATCGDEVTFTVTAADGFTNINAYQFGVEWDENHLTYTGSNAAAIGMINPLIGTVDAPTGLVTYNWLKVSQFGEDLPDNTVVLTLTFDVIGGDGSSNISLVPFGMPPSIEANNGEYCDVPVEVTDASIDIEGIDVTCPEDLPSVCFDADPIDLAALAGELPTGGTYTGDGVTSGIFNASAAGEGLHVITYTASDVNNCSNTCTFSITVEPEIEATLSVSDAEICQNGSVTITFNESNWPSGTVFSIAATLTDDNNAATPFTVTGVQDGGALTFTENVEFSGDVTIGDIVVTETASGCSVELADVVIDVLDSPLFGFTATVAGHDPQIGDNQQGPATISIDFCAGEFFSLSDYTDFGNPLALDFLEEITGGTGNVLYDASPIPVTRPTSVQQESFFGSGPYGPYNLAPGSTYGQIIQVFTPFIDTDNNNLYDPLIDCLGDPITLEYNIYAPIVLEINRLNNNEICSGDPVLYEFTTESSEDVSFDLVFELIPNINNPADLTDDNMFPLATTITINSSTPDTFTQVMYNDSGTFDVGRVHVRATNIRYADADVCTTADVDGQNTRIYPEPRLTNPGPQQVTSGEVLSLNFDPLDYAPSMNLSTAGYPIRIQWSVVASSGVNFTPANSSPQNIYNGAGVLNAIDDISGVVTLDNNTCNGTLTFTITPQSDGPNPGGGFDANNCSGTPFDVVVKVVKPVTLTHVYTDGPVACGDEVTVAVEVDNFCDISTLDYQFEWDETAFELVSLNTPIVTSPSGGLFSASSFVDGEIYLSFFDVSPLGETLADGTVILTYTLKAIGAPDTYTIPDNIVYAEAYDPDFSLLPVSSFAVPIELVPLSLVLDPVLPVCPSDDFLTLTFDAGSVVGNPDHWEVDYGSAAEAVGFPDSEEGTLVVNDESIILNLPNGLLSGSYPATLVVSNDDCESAPIVFNIMVDMMPPTVGSLPPITQACFPAPAPNPSIVTTEADNCPGPITVTFQGDQFISGTGCGASPHVSVRTYLVTDAAGNTATTTQVITIQDNVPPTVSTAGMGVWYSDSTAAINAALAIANNTKMDNCTPKVDITVLKNGNITYDGCRVTIHLIIRDACNNITSADYVTTLDTEDPTVEAGDIDDCYEQSLDFFNQYYPYQYAVEAAIQATTANDDCTDPEDLEISVSIGGDFCDLVITVTATDACGKSSSVEYLTRVENQAPILSYDEEAISIENGFCFTSVEDAEAAAIAATVGGDDCTDPNLLQYDASTSEGCPAVVTVTVTDFCGNFSEATFINVFIDGDDPQFEAEEEYTTCFSSDTAAFEYLIDAANPSDDCTDVEDLIASADAEFMVDPMNENEACMYGSVSITVTDRCGNAATYVFEGITIDGELPTLVEFPAVDEQYACIEEVPEPDVEGVVAEDNCGDVTVSWEGDKPPTSCPGALLRTYRLTDDCGNYTDVVQTIMVNDTIRPTFTELFPNSLDRTYNCDDPNYTVAFNLKPNAQDNCGDTILVKTPGAFVPSQDCPHEGTYTNTWVVRDKCGNESEDVYTQVITIIDNEAPTVDFGCQFMPALLLTTFGGADCPAEADISLEVGEYVTADEHWSVAGIQIDDLEGCVSDNCSDLSEIRVTLVKVTYGESDNEAIPPGCSKLITADFLISDACGNINPDTFTCQYLIIDNIAPEWVTPAGSLDFSMECSDQAAFDFANSQVPVASDNCPGNIRIFKEEGQFVAGLDCPSEGTITNVFVAVDTCDNSSEEFVQVIALFDNTAPEIDEECLTNTVNIYTEDGYSCPQLAEVSGISEGSTYNLQTNWSVGGYLIEGLPEGCVTDNCTDFENIILHVVSIETTDDLDTCARTIVITLQFEDQCGNLQEEPMVLTYNIIDNTPPEINSQILSFGGNEIFIDQCYPTALDAEIDAIAAVQAVAFDNCTATELLDYEATTTGTCAAVVTVTVTDCAGNTATHTFNTRIDGDGPTMTAGTMILCHPNIAAAEAAAKAATTIEDACSPFNQLDIVASTVGTCPATITVTATDACGNSNSVVYNNICIGTGNAVEITTEAANQSADCTMETTVFNTWIANNGGAIASGSGVTWTYSETAYTFDCNAHSKSKTVTFIATDNCGFTDSSTATFTVTDNMAPSANMISATNLTCVANIPMPNTALVTGVSDNCDQTPTVALFFQSSNSGTGCPNSPLTIMRTYSVTDDYCNTTYVTHTINVVDNVAPTFTAPANITINVDAMCNYDASVGVTGDVTNEQDGCSSGLNATFTDVVNSGSTPGVRWIISRTWRLTDACGNSAIPQIQTITVIDNILPTISCPGNISVVGSIQDNICVAQVNNIGPGVSNDNCGVATITYTMTGATTSSGNNNASGKFFKEGVTTVTYIVTDRAGNTATCSFTVTVTCTTISGKIIWEHNHIPGPPPSGLGVKDATVRLTLGVNQVGSTLTDVAGNYTLIAPGNATYQVTPVKNINRLNGVTAADATLIQQHVTNMNVITDPYKKIAADVNRNGAISGQDANLITQCLAGNVTALGIFNVFWRFVPTSTVLPVTAPLVVPTFTESISVTTTGPDVIDQNFYGVKLGDVNGSGNPALAPTGTPLVWVLRDRTLQTGADLVVDFAATNFNDLAALQFALDFDPSVLQFTGFESTDAIALGADNFGAAEAGLGALRVVWAQANGTTLADGTPVLRAKFKVLQGGQLLSEVLNLDPVSMDCSAYTETLVPSDVRVVYATSVATGDPLNPGKPALQLFQNQPNPFAGETTIGFVLPDACDAQLRITDVSGRELASYNRTYSAGYHEIEFRMQNAVAYGVLYYELTTPFGKLTRKMVTTGK